MSNKVYICDFRDCEKIFNSKYCLNRHITSKHYKKKKFECKQCGKKFSLAHNLTEHEYIHTQELPFVCGIDGWTQSFRQRGKLSLHREKHPNYKKRVYKKNVELNFQDDIVDCFGPLSRFEMTPGITNFEYGSQMRFSHQNKQIGFMGGLFRPDQLLQFDHRNLSHQNLNENVNTEERKDTEAYPKDESEGFNRNFFHYSSY